MPGSREQPPLQVGAALGLRPDALGVPVVVLGDHGAELLNASRHRAREAVDRRPRAEDLLELGRVGRGDRRGVERTEPAAQLERSREGLLDGHLLVEHEADEQRERVFGEEGVGLGIAGEMQGIRHSAAMLPLASLAEWARSPPSARRRATGSRARSTRRRPRRSAAGRSSRPARARLIQAPTGSGKTLAAFLWALDRAEAGAGTQVLYVSPLKALNYDVERNLRGPLAGIGSPLSVARPHGRHAGEGARARCSAPARHPDHDAGVALPAPHLAGAGDAPRRPRR